MGSTSFGLNRGLQNILDLRKLKIDQSCMGSARLEQECIVKLKFRKVACLVGLFAAQSRMQPTVSLSKADCNREQGFIAFASSLSPLWLSRNSASWGSCAAGRAAGCMYS
jgi:hypothetical protein